jgi:hypothetical protein
MSSIDDVINRSRQPGGFKERKRFSVARQRAIQKMRQFALADPHYYVLELIQAAVANGGRHVDLQIDKSSFGLSYVGGGFVQEELAQLFDFLFASKEDFEHGDIRQLALGINAMMIMEPTTIVIESGDGTISGTTRIEINTKHNTVDVGTPDKSLRGTFVRAEGLSRGNLRGKSNLRPTNYGPPECMAIENRCLAAPVPIIINDHPVFGYSSVRTPALFGFENVVTFDEGDLYGSLGIPRQQHNNNFKLLTWGCWVQSLEHHYDEATWVGGVVAYDRLNKTADHSGIVQDERLEQLWARLQPYVHKATRGQSGRAVFQIAPLGGDELDPRELRELLVGAGRAVVVSNYISPDGNVGERAARIGEALEAPVLAVHSDEMATLRSLAGSEVRLLEPDLSATEELAFYEQPVSEPPERPWLIGASELEPIPVEEFVDHVVSEELVPTDDKVVDELRHQLGGGALRGTVYTPAQPVGGEDQAGRTLWVRLRALDRVLWSGPVDSAYPGHVLDIDVEAPSASALLNPVDGGLDVPLARLVGEVMARYAAADLERTAERALQSFKSADVAPGSVEAHIALAALARHSIKRLRTDSEGHTRVHLSVLESGANFDLLAAPLFRTLDGAHVSMRDLTELLAETAGLVYGVVPQVEPDLAGLDTSRILDLDLETERLLMSILGEGAYVRIDRRDVLAQSDVAAVRDMALGLREYPAGSMLVEGDAVEAGAEPAEPHVEALVGQLIELFGGARGGRDVALFGGDEVDLRRQAVRHLQYFVCRRRLHEASKPTYGVETLGLFVDGRGQAASLEDILAGFEAHGELIMVDGRSGDVTDVGSADRPKAPRDKALRALTMNTFVLGLLEQFGPLIGAFDFAMTDDEAAERARGASTAFFASTAIDGEHVSGAVGLPETPVDDPAIGVVSADHAKMWMLRQPAIEYGVVGMVRLHKGDVEARWNQIYAAARRAALSTLEDLIGRLSQLRDEQEYERILETLFDFAARHLSLSQDPGGSVHAKVSHHLAQRILDVPLFATDRGIPVSAQRIINEFCVAHTRGRAVEGRAHVELADEVPAVLTDWVARELRPERIARPAAEPAPTSPARAADGGSARGQRWLEKTVQQWLRRLRPDDHVQAMARKAASDEVASEGRPSDSSEPAEVFAMRASVKDADERTRRAQDLAGSYALRVWAIDATDRQARRNLPNHRMRSAVDQMGDGPLAYSAGRPPVLVINTAHWLARNALERDATALAWLLLAAYAHVNALLEPVTNDHELEFQQRIAEALQNGQLAGVSAGEPSRS